MLGLCPGEAARKANAAAIAATSAQIDEIVYELYGLTAEDIKIVES